MYDPTGIVEAGDVMFPEGDVLDAVRQRIHEVTASPADRQKAALEQLKAAGGEEVLRDYAQSSVDDVGQKILGDSLRELNVIRDAKEGVISGEELALWNMAIGILAGGGSIPKDLRSEAIGAIINAAWKRRPVPDDEKKSVYAAVRRIFA